MKTPDRRALRRIELKNLLSFGPDSPALDLENLNILIGANGSGKSNLIQALSLLRATPMPPASAMDVQTVVAQAGANEWVWKGCPTSQASIDVFIDSPDGKPQLRHFLSFTPDSNGLHLREERIEVGGRQLIKSAGNSMNGSASILSVRANFREPERYPDLIRLTESYEKIRIYRDWRFGPKTNVRGPQVIGLLDDQLEEGFLNLYLFLARITESRETKAAILSGLKDLYYGVMDFYFKAYPETGTMHLFFKEGDFPIPASRLSDGALHYLCLLTILCDPNPPPLICIEEPELGLHPDILPKLADLLIEASGRTQLIVTTHSDALVDAMTSRPESVVVCEKRDGQTHMKRLSKAELKPWLQEYRLGQLWASGEIGGNRW